MASTKLPNIKISPGFVFSTVMIAMLEMIVVLKIFPICVNRVKSNVEGFACTMVTQIRSGYKSMETMTLSNLKTWSRIA